MSQDEALRLSLESQRLFADADPWTRAGLAATSAAWASGVGDYALAVEQAEEAVRCARLAGHPSHLATALYTYGWVFAFADDEAARRALEEGIELIRPAASAVGAARWRPGSPRCENKKVHRLFASISGAKAAVAGGKALSDTIARRAFNRCQLSFGQRNAASVFAGSCR